MKKLLSKLSVLCGLLVAPAFVIISIPLPRNSYDLAIVDKHALLENAQSPKWVLAGGSNLAFGIDSAQIQRVCGRPVINMGVHAGFGLGRILDDSTPFLHAGDVLVIAAEYQHFSSMWNGGREAYELIIDSGFIKHQQYRLLASGNYGIPKGFVAYLSKIKTYGGVKSYIRKFRKPDPRAYSRYGFNEYGDYIGHLEFDPAPIFPIGGPVSMIDNDYIASFFNIVKDLHERGITILITYPPYTEESYDESRDCIRELDAVFRQNRDMAVISKPESYRFPREYFYDTHYHLNKHGREIRTRQLVHDIEKWRKDARR